MKVVILNDFSEYGVQKADEVFENIKKKVPHVEWVGCGVNNIADVDCDFDRDGAFNMLVEALGETDYIIVIPPNKSSVGEFNTDDFIYTNMLSFVSGIAWSSGAVIVTYSEIQEVRHNIVDLVLCSNRGYILGSMDEVANFKW